MLSIPKKHTVVQEFISYFDQISSPWFVVGDFNAHHSFWAGSGVQNATGLNLVCAISDLPDLFLITYQNF